MPINFDPLLILPADFDDFRDISKNIDPDRLNVYVRESQVKEMRSFLGDTLYLALINDYTEVGDTFSEQRFTDLWFGSDYDFKGNQRRFYGLKPAIVYYAYSRFIKNQQVNVTRYGVKHINDENSEDETVQQVRTKTNDANSYGLLYQADAELFLNENQSDYPEFEVSETAGEKKTSFKFTKLVPVPDILTTSGDRSRY